MAQVSLADLVRNVDITKGTAFELLKPGEYDATVWEVEFKFSKSNNPMFVVKYKITEGDSKGRYIWQYVTFTENNAHISTRHLLACGAESQDAIAEALKAGVPALDFCKTLVDNLVTLKLGIEEGKEGYDTKNNVKNVVARTAVKADADALAGSKPKEKKDKASARPSTPF